MTQMAKSLRPPPERETTIDLAATVGEELELLKWYLWHGNTFHAWSKTADALDTSQSPPAPHRYAPESSTPRATGTGTLTSLTPRSSETGRVAFPFFSALAHDAVLTDTPGQDPVASARRGKHFLDSVGGGAWPVLPGQQRGHFPRIGRDGGVCEDMAEGSGDAID